MTTSTSEIGGLTSAAAPEAAVFTKIKTPTETDAGSETSAKRKIAKIALAILGACVIGAAVAAAIYFAPVGALAAVGTFAISKVGFAVGATIAAVATIGIGVLLKKRSSNSEMKKPEESGTEMTKL